MSSKTKLSNKLIPDHIPLDYAAKQKERLEKNWSKFPPPLRELLKKVKQCRKCPELVKSRETYLYSEPTFGYGNPDSPVVLIAQAPGWLGCGTTGFVFEPLSRTGKIYEAVLRAAGLSFEHVYTTNLVKCCPRGSDAPTKQQIRNCEVYCLREIKLINPFSIIAVGKLPWDFVMRNKLYKDFQCHRVFHPGYILRKGFGIDRYISSFAALLKSEYKKGASKKGLRRWL